MSSQKLALQRVPAIAMLMLLVLSVVGFAAEEDTGVESGESAQGPSSAWSFLAGAGVYVSPEYTGSDELDTLVFPSVDVFYKDIFFFSLTNGVGVNLIRDDVWWLSLSGQLVMGREAEGDAEFLPPVDDRLMPKLELKNTAGPVSLIASVLGDSNRYMWELGVEKVMPASDALVFLLGAGVKWNNKAWNDERYSVSAADAPLAGVQPFQAGSGISEQYLQAAMVFYPSRRHVLEIVGELGRLDGDAGDSPITDVLGRRLQPSMLLKFSWIF